MKSIQYREEFVLEALRRLREEMGWQRADMSNATRYRKETAGMVRWVYFSAYFVSDTQGTDTMTHVVRLDVDDKPFPTSCSILLLAAGEEAGQIRLKANEALWLGPQSELIRTTNVIRYSSESLADMTKAIRGSRALRRSLT